MDTTLKIPAAVMPLYTHWNSQELADAVPLRLSQLIDFNAMRDGDPAHAGAIASANAASLHGIRSPRSFLQIPALSLFRTR